MQHSSTSVLILSMMRIPEMKFLQRKEAGFEVANHSYDSMG